MTILLIVAILCVLIGLGLIAGSTYNMYGADAAACAMLGMASGLLGLILLAVAGLKWWLA